MSKSKEDSKSFIFSDVAKNNLWGDADSRSGPGSNLIQTQTLRPAILKLIQDFGIKSMLDAPCGDFFWMKEIKKELSNSLSSYVGGDIVPDLIQINNNEFGDKIFCFKVLDITKDLIPKVDLIFTRDCFIHLSYKNIYKALKNYKESGSAYLLVSTYTKPRPNFDVDVVFISGRAINLGRFPFFFSKPLTLINENCTEGNGEYADKSMALWKLSDINLATLKVYLFLKSIKSWIKAK